MESGYYVKGAGGQREGPYDLVTVMRRIRVGKITPDMLVMAPGYADALRADHIPDLALFFNRTADDASPSEPLEITLSSALKTGWQFTQKNSAMTVYAGGLLLIILLIVSMLAKLFGPFTGVMTGWVAFICFHNLYLMFILRIHRGQTVSAEFISRRIIHLLPKLLLGSILQALMIAAGLALIILPALAVWVLTVFMPFSIMDHRYAPIEAMKASRRLLQKHDNRYLLPVGSLLGLHMISMLLIIPLPLTLPIFAGALADCYDNLITA